MFKFFKSRSQKEKINILLLVGFIVILHLYLNDYFKAFWNVFFNPFQRLRASFFQLFSCSLGDIFYLILLINVGYRIYQYFKNKNQDLQQERYLPLLKLVKNLLSLYFYLVLLWINLYEQKPLSASLQLHKAMPMTKAQLSTWDSILVTRLNTLSVHIQPQEWHLTQDNAQHYYTLQGMPHAYKVKASLLGDALAYLGIEGYYNPFSGEAQINPKLPSFLLPFTICHEMAHQNGIAAEDEANLCAYIVCQTSQDAYFQYAASFNLWLYTHKKLYKKDSVLANQIKQRLNPISNKHLVQLKAYHKEHQSILDDISTVFYDQFLKLGNQKKGIQSYSDVVYTAWQWEQEPVKMQIKDYFPKKYLKQKYQF